MKTNKLKEYCVYKGDFIVFTGTVKEIAAYFGVKERTVRWWGTSECRRRDKGNAKVLVYTGNKD